MKTSEPIDEPNELPGTTLYDQDEEEIGEIKQVFDADEGDGAMWVSIEGKFGMADKKVVYAPIARLKKEGEKLRIPYSKDHVQNGPELESDDAISPEEDLRLRDHYGIDRADNEQRTDNDSYASRVPAERGTGASVSESGKGGDSS